jgi:hypothetical protein
MRGEARFGEARVFVSSQTRHGAAWHGGARLGGAGLGRVWRGKDIFKQPNVAWKDLVSTGTAGPGLSRFGEARVFNTLKGQRKMQFDIDVTGLEPGDNVEQSVCEQLIGMERKGNEYAYQFALLQLGDFIQKSLWKIGKQFTVRTTNQEVQVLTHEEASKYNASRFELAIAKLRRCNRRLNAVDPGQLTKEAREEHGRTIIRQSRVLSLLKSANSDLTPEPEKRERIKLGDAVAS